MQHVERPQRIIGEREGGRTIAEQRRPFAGGAADRGERPAEVVGELGRRLAIKEPVRIAVAAELVARVGDFAHQLGMAVGDPAEHEERRPCPMPRQQRKDTAGVVDHAPGETIPGRRADGALVGMRVKVILDVDRERVAHVL